MNNFKRNSSSNLNKENTKKLKTTQSNTLLNYFVSSNSAKTESKEVISVQSSILSFFKSNKPVLSNNDSSNSNSNTTKTEPEIDIDQQTKSAFSFKYEKIESFDETPKTYSSNRKCPFYKRIEGTKITVDAFSYGLIEDCDAYFLSHFHYDHYTGLSKNFDQKIFCSQITANLVLKKIKVDQKYINPLEMNKFIRVYDQNDSIHVALIDANHCPGSVMFLFRISTIQSGKYKYILHTGDFRASEELIQNSMLQNIKIHTVHLDTTYCDSFYKFLPQSQVIAIGADLVLKELKKQPKALICCGSYLIGKERVFMAIAEKLGVKVCVTRDKFNILSCFNDNKLNKMLTLNANETNLHVIQMGQLNLKDLEEYLAKFPSFNYLIAIKPTGWTHKEESSAKATTQTTGFSIERKSKNAIIYGLEYSEHSSFEELGDFVRIFRPGKIVPHVNVATKESRDKMSAYFNEWKKI